MRSLFVFACAASFWACGAVPAAPADAAPALYTAKDYGAPPTSLAPQRDAVPTVFNNTGQMAGTYSPQVGGAPYCLAYTGTKWISITDPTARLCEAWAMSDAHDAKFAVVGRVGSSFESGDKSGFYSVVTGSTAVMHLYGANYPSSVSWINATGVAVGRSDYQLPSSTFNGPASLLFESSGGPAFVPVVPCTLAPGKLCPEPVPENAAGYQGNHYRELNATATYFAVDIATGAIMEGTLGKADSAFDLPIVTSKIPCFTPFGIDDKADFYFTECPGSNGALGYVYRYDPATKKTALLPHLAGSDCTDYIPWSMNGNGEIYGNNQNCSKSTSVMWVYDPVTNVTSNLSAQLPTVKTVCGEPKYQLKELNDRGQILIDIGGCSGQPDHWGILSPPP